uniref:Uncharacterized protein n=1 Tax=Anguilla anguilla TaxID=7936 RepID=A0A0E9UIB4_ANGAN
MLKVDVVKSNLWIELLIYSSREPCARQKDPLEGALRPFQSSNTT